MRDVEFEKMLKSNLVDTVLLSSKIAASPYKVSVIADMIGMSYDTLNRRLNREGQFHLYEAAGLSLVLQMSLLESYEAFLDPYVKLLVGRSLHL